MRINENRQKDVWALSCIGAWVGIVYNQRDKGAEVEQTKRFFRDNVPRRCLLFAVPDQCRLRSGPRRAHAGQPGFQALVF